jgi:soluble lytic murein transglycosylase-like protein
VTLIDGIHLLGVYTNSTYFMKISFSISPRRCLFGALLILFCGMGLWQFQLDRTIINVARQQGVSPFLLHSVAVQESNLNPVAEGAAGEIGMFQIMPNTAKHWAERTGKPIPTEEELFRVSLNAEISAWYLRQGLDEFADTEDPLAAALAYYNAGPSRARRWLEDLPDGIAFEDYIPFSSTRKYVKQVKSRLP